MKTIEQRPLRSKSKDRFAQRLLLALSIQLSVFSFLMAADIMPEEALQIANTFIQKDKTAQSLCLLALCGYWPVRSYRAAQNHWLSGLPLPA